MNTLFKGIRVRYCSNASHCETAMDFSLASRNAPSASTLNARARLTKVKTSLGLNIRDVRPIKPDARRFYLHFLCTL
jgi:hypothetical protein